MRTNMYSYGWEQLNKAAYSLCGAGSLADRLATALEYYLIHITPEDDLPKELREEFQEFMTSMALTSIRGNEGTIQAMIDNLDELTLLNATDKILGFTIEFARYQEPS